jgi:peptidyl-tRNA hydrolase, PTH1 family
MKLIVGLGNPGILYKKTRHNVGFMVVDNFAKERNLNFDKKKFNGSYLETIINNEKVIFLKPQKYMNLSGEVIKKYVDYFNIDINDILVICDDLDTELGKLKIKFKGSSGGHNGLKNIELNLATSEYKRLKIGIKSSFSDKKNYVLGKFNKDDQKLIDHLIIKSVDIIDDYFNISFENLMSKYN